MDRSSTYSGRPQVIDLISVVFESELALLQIQARSIELYFTTTHISTIFVIVNDEDRVAEKIDCNWWGDNAAKVRIIPRSKISVYSFLDGWSSQQLYKLAAANLSESDWSMCLDAKTWFVDSINWDKIWDDTGKANFKSLRCMQVFQSAKNFAELFFNIKFENVIGPAGVPFLFHTDTIKELVEYVENVKQQNFLDFFAEKLLYPVQITEFVLYSAFVHYKKRYNFLYSDKQYYSITNIADWQIDHFDKLLDKMESPNNLTASIQGRAYPHLSDSQFDKWLDFLLSKQLITNRENTKILLNTLR